MSRNNKRGPAGKRGKKGKSKSNTKDFMMTLSKGRRGFFTLRRRLPFYVETEFFVLLNNATVLSPNTYAYLNLSNPLKSNGGAATVVSDWSNLMGLDRKFVITHIHVVVEFVSQEAFPTLNFLGPVNYLPPNTVAQATLTKVSPFAVKRMASGVGSPNKTRLEIGVDLARFGGFNPRNAEDAHWGGLSPPADPVDNMYAHFGSDTNGVASVNGILASVTLGFRGIAAEINDSL